MTHTHTIWSLVHDSDRGTDVQLFGAEEERDARCSMIMAEWWSDTCQKEPIPIDWREAWEFIQGEGVDFWIDCNEHEVTLL
jgi:hypothetical protein